MTEQAVVPPADEPEEPFGPDVLTEAEPCAEADAESLTDLLAAMAAERYLAGDLWSLYRQDIWWTTRKGTLMRINALLFSHRLNIARMLLRTAAKIYPEYQQDLLLRCQTDDLIDPATDAIEDQPADPNPPVTPTDQDAQDWMSTTVLYRRIVRGLPDPARPEPDPVPTPEHEL